MYTVIDGKLFKKMLIGSYQLMNEKCEIINQLNVFPVPDGDTGNNMLHTLRSMYSMIAEMNDSEPVGIIYRGYYGSTRKLRCYFISNYPWDF